ncbi:hypothetical protein GCM10007424_13350 [Flavobacterium suaedae]|uniref:Uncharacterized protein n=1 Tax=Flavobacterium suaedae TaxID=1767027 RepID=A0ABQ1JUA4_9FLAO|nr:hypothetical protein [Flavobacterium suaedae]GGB74731.1 hypothetical protein GCM10007424_13350 [Flavobacterium suaedae]
MEKITYDAMRNFILENELTDSVAISLHPDSFDELVMDYLDFNGNKIERPFEILGIEILQDNTGSVSKNKINTMNMVQ